MATSFDLSIFDIPSSTSKVMSDEDLSALLIDNSNTVANMTAESAEEHVAIKDYVTKMHKKMRDNPELVHVLSDEAIGAYFVTLESLSNMGFLELTERLWTKPKAVKKTKAQVKEDLKQVDLDIGDDLDDLF